MTGEEAGEVELIAGWNGITPAKTMINFVINILYNIAPTLFKGPVFGIPG
jgi:hypothetical protein